MSATRILVGALAGATVIAALFTIGLRFPSAVAMLLLLVFGVCWTWFLARSLSTGSVLVRSGRYLRRESPVAYWFWLGFFFLSGAFLIVGGGYALIANWTSR